MKPHQKREGEGFDSYVEFLRVRRGRTIYLKPYWGNSGDELIWMGSDILLRDLGLNRVLNPKAADIILIPGGNATMWDSPLSEWQDCWERWPNAEFVVGPSGFHGFSLPWREMLQTSTAKIAGMFARDLTGYENLCQLDLPPTVTVGLAHDPAFHLKESEWVTELREANLSEYILAAFRGDCESAIPAPAAGRLFDIWPMRSIFFRYKHRCQMRYVQERLKAVRQMAGSDLPLVEQDASLMSFQKYVECINRADQVHTDRLHCMILASLLGKEIYAYSTAYGKLEGVYEQSMKGWANVHFVNQTPRI